MSSESSRPARRQVRQTQANSEAVSSNSDTADSSVPENSKIPEQEVFPAPSAPLPEPDAPAPVMEPIPSLTEDTRIESESVAEPAVTAPEVALPPVQTNSEVTEAGDEEVAPLTDTVPNESKKAGLKGRLSKSPKNGSEEGAKGAKKRSYNPKRKSLIITGSVVGGIVLVLGFSLYKVNSAPSTDDIISVYQEQSGDLGFPIDKGVESATRFLSLYLTIPEDASVRQQNTELLNEMLINATAPQAPQGISQRIVSGPTPAGLMGQETAGTANQRYTALVETTTREAQQGTDFSGSPAEDKVTKTLQQVTYRVNLTVDPTGTVVLVDGNPTLLPNQVITSDMKILTPLPAPDGTFGNELNNSLITPFFKAWAASDKPAVNALLATGSENMPWTSGLQGAQNLGDVLVGAPVGVSGAGEGDVVAQVNWIAPDGTRQTSTYTLTVVYENSRWLVSNLT